VSIFFRIASQMVIRDDAPRPPWLSWPREIPRRRDPLPPLREYQLIHDAAFIATMAKEIRTKVLTALRARIPAGEPAALLLKGGTSQDFDLYDTDVTKCEFRQEAFFRYLFPINEPDLYAALDLRTGAALLFYPAVAPDMARWNGPEHGPGWYRDRYLLEECHHVTDIAAVLHQKGFARLYTLNGVNSDSGSRVRTVPDFDGIDAFAVDSTVLYPVLEECRTIKTAKEVALMRAGNLVTSQAHLYVMRHIRSGLMELHLETMFKAWTGYFGGSRELSYTCICGSGTNGSILHYGHAARPNDRTLEDGDMVVLDMGAEYAGYGTDVTRSYPVTGRFTPDQAAIFRAVRAAQLAVMGAMKPGVFWPDMHRLAERVILEHLLRIGILRNGSVDDCMAAFLGSVFMPHGLGHLLGMNVHDCGGFPTGTARPTDPGPCWLRLGRELAAGMVVTVEPGIYFNGPWLDAALAKPAQAKYLNPEVLDRFRSFGGVRLEDDVLVTETGIENLTVLPSTVEEIEAVMGAASTAASVQ
jgi:Xaa-Pro dipeptidase